ncbi:OprO/OprP family phosphate-selective porin [Luteimonas abyssi]|uniref:OprO/OprP family phosphate-selective porin n=1 Tax=Luteimonas abyssi TaxID=1247514 RepID=UPI000737C877|nr:porin [Luteimonas abyssi]
MNHSNLRAQTRALAAGALLGLATLPAMAADTATETELRELIRLQAEQLRQQSEQLQALNQRLSAIEGGAQAVAASPAAPATTPGAPAADPVQAQVDAAVADTRQDDLAILQAQVAQLAAGGGSGGGNTSWRRGGPEFRNSDRSFTFNPRGRVLMDFSSTRGSSFDDRNITGTNMRQVRLGAQGNIGQLGYKVDAEFANNDVSISDAYLRWNTTLGAIPTEFYFGNKLKDRAIDSSTTLTRTPFMERNAVASVGMPASGYFGLGAQMKMIGQNWHTTFGITGDDVGNSGDNSDSLTYSFRGHVNPIKRPAGFLHVGGWYVHEEYGADTNRINRTPRIASRFNDNVRVSASAINEVTGERVWGTELGGTWRNFWGFWEHSETTLKSDDVGDVKQKATSAYAGWLLTGERPGFSARSGVWGTTRVARPVTDGGIGAWELAVRYDDYDFTDARRGGEGDAWTLGVNWYLNNWSRVMLNYVHWTTDNQVGAYQGRDTGNSINLRTQIVF